MSSTYGTLNYGTLKIAKRIITNASYDLGHCYEDARTIYACSLITVKGTMGHPACEAGYDKVSGQWQLTGAANNTPNAIVQAQTDVRNGTPPRARKTNEPEAIDWQNTLNGIKDNLSPQAVAVIVCYLNLNAHPYLSDNLKDRPVAKELAWLRDEMIKLLGGVEAYDRICDELKF